MESKHSRSKNSSSTAAVPGNNEDDNGRTSQSRRTACDVCRERKVRCDRSYPQCGRCLRLRHKCNYTPSSKNSIDVPKALRKLDSRIAQAEARLALGNSGTMAYPSPLVDLNNYSSWNWLDTTHALAQFPDIPGMSYEEISSTNVSLDPSTLGAIDVSCGMMKQTLDEFGSDHGRDNILLPDGISSSPDLIISSLESNTLPYSPIHSERDFVLSREKLVEPHRQYFENLHPLLPMIDRSRSIAALEDASSQSPEFNSLIYAIAMVGAGISKENDELVSACHYHARRCLEDAERQYPGARFLSIHALQAMLLITYHEFKRQDFARGWMSLGRALRLARLMKLHEIDMETSSNEIIADSAFQLRMQKPATIAEIEERRRTFWVAYILDIWACHRTNSGMSFTIDEIHTSLPSNASSPEFHTVDQVMRLGDALCSSADQPLPPVSAFAGLVIVCGLGAICNRHSRISERQQASAHKKGLTATFDPLETEGGSRYPFWVQHFAIDKKLQVVSHCLFRQLQMPQQERTHFTNQQQQPQQDFTILPGDASILIVYLNFYAISIYLHKTAAEQSVSTSAPESLREETDRRSETAAVQMVSVLHRMHSKDTYNMNILKQTNTFVLWSLTCAGRILSRLLDSSIPGKRQRRLYSTLELLYETMTGLDDDSGSWDETINRIREQLHRISLPWTSNPPTTYQNEFEF